jgi:hypothetical protein
MIRLMGILTGSAIAVAFLIVTLGIPELEAPQPLPAAAPQPVAPADSARATEPALVPEPAPQPQPATQAETAAAVAQMLPAAPEAQPEPEASIEQLPTSIEQQWYAFWSPFRSKVAADGFVSQLQRTTGLDYRVVKLEPGVYEVAFAYSDDSDIQEKLLQISSATGLDLSGG